MNKKGFISVTVIYSFFLIFLTLMMLIVVNMVTNRNLVNNIKSTTKDDIMVEVKLISEVCSNGNNLADCIINFADIGKTYNTHIYHHDSSLTGGAGDNSYRYAGASASVNNYVCIGSTETTCPDANLFRIIGVFNNQVKVIKATSIGDMAWDDNGYNTWSISSLYAYLQGTYLTSISSFSSKIATATWKVGGTTMYNIVAVTPAVAYTNEMTSTNVGRDNNYEISAQIGLMYFSDYEFAASPTAWTLVGYWNDDSTKDYRAATSINWLYLGSSEWTISRFSPLDCFGVLVYSAGQVNLGGDNCGTSCEFAVRPAFYLNSNVAYVSGQGSKIDPIRIG